MGKGEVGGMLDEHHVGVQKAEDIAIEVGVRKDDGIDKALPEEADRQRLDVDDAIKPKKMEVGAFREDNFPAEDVLVVEETDVPFTAR
ncbi:hypothetical protein OIDMADRAFT_116089 [Oidiodendron maius Zn]|uniref:Uncharacterized protein n=1 Tax=Oidiodendron maius (strain Zn) TaxID=913774 RepID=A0A0C3DSX5_OIDMZ|nr:hypothetical protein OIDMADRAFT_116089 [Oidiodendron maius Zn]